MKLFHEIGNETTDVFDKDGDKIPRVDPVTTAYRPGTRAVNYRSEPFMRRLERDPDHRWKSLAYNSYTFGDPATPMLRGYLADPTKIRITHAGTEVFHVYHLHGGGIRWRFNPHADPSWDPSDTGLNKHPKAQQSASTRLDSQSTGPGESYDLQIEGGAGGVQQSAGDFLYHCHIAEHYVAGMWSFWRVYDTRQPDLMPLPDRAAPPSSVTSDRLIGKTMPDGTTLTKDNLDAWIKPQLPPQGTPRNDEDATVWDYAVDRSNAAAPVYLGEPEDKSGFEDMRDGDHPGAMPGDTFVGDRPTIRFNPVNGRPAFPLLRPHFNSRAPFSPQGHAGAPWLGERGDAAKTKDGPDPNAGRPDGICPSDSTVRRFDIVSLELPIQVTQKGATDPNGKIFALAKDADDILAGRKEPEPLAIRGNIGDCIRVTLTSRQKDTAESPFSMTNIHIHHVQFDVQASDGVGTGMQFGQAVRPYALEDPTLTEEAAAGLRTLHLSDVAKFHVGASIAVGEGTTKIEIRDIEAIDAAAGTVTLDKPLDHTHPAGDYAGTEFVQYTWYPDVELDNVFWHDHVDGIHNWGHGLVGQFIVEPRGSTYHDPATGEEVESGTYVDIHTANPLAAGSVNGAFRELALWEINENPATDSTMNLRSVPFADRAGDDPSLLFSSYRWGDPNTPLPKAYAGDPFVIRSISVSPTVDSLKLDGHRFTLEPRYVGTDGKPEGTPIDSHLRGDLREVHGDPRGRRRGHAAAPGRLPVLQRRRPPLPPRRVGHPARPAQAGGRPARAAGHGRAGRRRLAAGGHRRAAARDQRRGQPVPERRQDALLRRQRGRHPQRRRGRQGGVRPDGRRRGGPQRHEAARAAGAARGGRRVRRGALLQRAHRARRGQARAARLLPRGQAGPDGRVVGRQRRLQPGADRRRRRAPDLPLLRRHGEGRQRDDLRLRRPAGGPRRPLRRDGRRPVGRLLRRSGDGAAARHRQPGGRARARRAQLPRLLAAAVGQRPGHRRQLHALPDRGRRPGAGQLPQRAAGRRRRDVQLARQRGPGDAGPAGVRRRPDEGARGRRRPTPSSRTRSASAACPGARTRT